MIKSQITKSDKVLQKLEEEKKHALKTISNAEKSLKRPPATKTVGENLVPPSESKSVVEAASAVVASMSQKLRSAENELAVIKGLLQKERHAHGVTLEKLSKFERS
ncbi:MAG: hypothetical protein K8823_796 [Cenarchaeum symbiont of Oopsacas minuta]|nr:hypothetical protein [Cenarchaeum symbiont of Oopsacas minuta]